MTVTDATKGYSVEKTNRVFQRIPFVSYFPVRFVIACFVISIFTLSYLMPTFQYIETHTISFMLKLVNIPSFSSEGDFYLGTPFVPHEIALPKNLQVLFTIFYISLAITVTASSKMRAKILGFGALNYVVSIVTQFVALSILHVTQANPGTWFLQSDFLTTAIISGLMIEFMIFSVLTLPPKSKIVPTLKRSYKMEYVFFIGSAIISFLIFRFILQSLQIEVDSAVGIYAVINVLLMLNFSNYLGYIAWQIRVPKWLRLLGAQKDEKYNPPVTFLLAAYNEQKFIRRCIGSIDRAAANYEGKTTIILINDGSTDSTPLILAEIMPKLKHAIGRFITIPNSGKGIALNTGLKDVSDDIIFRIDSDSEIEKNSIKPIVRHFLDPDVGTVGGMIFSIEEKSILQRIFNVSSVIFSSLKKTQDLFDIMTIQSGAFSVFRKQALIQAGGWAEHQFGEDGEITVRIGRLGYRNNFEDRATIWSDAPSTINELRRQRARWALAFYQSRNRNMPIIKERRGPRSLYYLYNLLTHGLGFVNILYWPFFIASLLANYPVHFHINQLFSFLIRFPYPLIMTEVLIFSVHYVAASYFLYRFGKLRSHFPYMFLVRFYQLIILMIPRMEALNVMFSWSSKYKKHNIPSFKALGQELRKSLDVGI